MGKLRKRIRKAEGNGSMEQYDNYSTCLGAAQSIDCEHQCHRSGIDNYAMALVRGEYKMVYFAKYGK